MSGMTTEELVLAYELHCEGCCWKRIASGLGYDPLYIKTRVHHARDRGIRNQLTGFDAVHAPRTYHKKILEAALLHRASGMPWRQVVLTLFGKADRATAKSLCDAVWRAKKAGHIGRPQPPPQQQAANDDEPRSPVPASAWTRSGFRIKKEVSNE